MNKNWYKVEIEIVNDFSELYDWVVKQFTQDMKQKRWKYKFGLSSTTDTFLFKYKKDAVLFALRWK
jgi:hypothetical protein